MQSVYTKKKKKKSFLLNGEIMSEFNICMFLYFPTIL